MKQVSANQEMITWQTGNLFSNGHFDRKEDDAHRR
jgi:hypothetical protein